MTKLLKMSGISKAFSGVQVLRDVQFELERGEVHILLGENGAGKSTLMKILGGNYSLDGGRIEVDGAGVQVNNVEDARRHGIRIIHQELMMVNDLNVAENIFLGEELVGHLGFVDKSGQIESARQKLSALNLSISATARLGDLTIAQRQMVEITRAVSFGAKIIVMDEPTSSLFEEEVRALFGMIAQLKSEGIGIVYISHRMSELFEIGDRVTVLRDGEYIGTRNISDVTKDDLVSMMVGRSIGRYYTRSETVQDEVVLEVEGLSDGGVVKDVNFDLRRGEILGFAGLIGAGRTECMEILFGLRKRVGGTIRIHGSARDFTSTRAAIDGGLGLVPEDRKSLGIFPDQGARFNATISVLEKFLGWGRYAASSERDLAKKYIDLMKIKVSGPEQPVFTLSGGNQQKVLIARWLLATRDVLVLDEPTRGVDVGTKAEIYALMNELAANGKSIILVSSELPELINMCDRIAVMSQGVLRGCLEREQFSQEMIMDLATHESHGIEGGR